MINSVDRSRRRGRGASWLRCVIAREKSGGGGGGREGSLIDKKRAKNGGGEREGELSGTVTRTILHTATEHSESMASDLPLENRPQWWVGGHRGQRQIQRQGLLHHLIHCFFLALNNPPLPLPPPTHHQNVADLCKLADAAQHRGSRCKVMHGDGW
jgi:hypothetical protein